MASTSKLMKTVVMLLFLCLCLVRGSRGSCSRDCAEECMDSPKPYVCIMLCMRRCQAGHHPPASALDYCNLGCATTNCLSAKKSSDAKEVRGCLAACSKNCSGN